LGVAFYRGAEACILVYDMMNPKSFESLNQWKSDFILKSGPPNPEKFPFFLIGNKCDKADERKVSMDYVQNWIKMNNNLPYEETSAT
jgi:Ras-related protein Rab-7A